MKKLHLIVTIILLLAVSYLISVNYIEAKLQEKLAKRLYSHIDLDVDSNLQTSDTLILNAVKKIEEAEIAFDEYLIKDTTQLFNNEIGEVIMINMKMGYNLMQSINPLLRKYPEQSNRLKVKFQAFYNDDPNFYIRKSTLERLHELKSIKQELFFLSERLKCQ